MCHNSKKDSRDGLSTISLSAQEISQTGTLQPLNIFTSCDGNWMSSYEEMNVVWIHDLLPQYDSTLLRYLFVKLSQIRCDLSYENRPPVFRAPYEVIIDAILAARCAYPVLLLRHHEYVWSPYINISHTHPLLYPTFEKVGISSNNILKSSALLEAKKVAC